MQTGKKKILVHTCCAACASPVFSQLEKAGFLVVAFFYNPQINAEEEYLDRLSGLRKLCQENNFTLEASTFAPSEFSEMIRPFKDMSSIKYISDPDRYRRRRCALCNNMLIQKTVEQAKKMRIKYFTSTLLCSPYKNHDEIIESSNEKSLDYGLNFYYYDFRKGYWMGRNYAKSHELYIPKYCGCLESEKERRLE